MSKINMKKLRGTLLSGLMLAGAYAVANILGAQDALAQSTDLAGAMDDLREQIGGATQVIYTGSYIGGTTALMMGAFKLKAHAENPGQTPMQQGLARLAVGAGLIALPSVGETITNSLGVDKNQTLNSQNDQFGIN
ncbi:MAG TPA: hypothetical protein PKW15_02045 [Alphaproteobacteria bacterium]|nr:hypothetical protein [Alphaproteobacteria bacterium]